ncbi:MAG: nascent polypeptide-associated complex protein [Desulfurococcaceae archaeon]
MFPKFNLREFKRAMQRLGINVEELSDVEKVEIYFKSKKIVIEKPQVTCMKFQNQTLYQIIGSSVEEQTFIEYSEEDIDFIISQTGVSRDKALEALKRANGDVAEAILLIRESRV